MRAGSLPMVTCRRAKGGQRLLVQVCESIANPATRARELAALDEAMRELGLAEGTLVTPSVDEQIPVSDGNVRASPAWRFWLEIDAAGDSLAG
jgi:predicted AAA+ superfamily ATPase